jgi:hypothetical protein
MALINDRIKVQVNLKTAAAAALGFLQMYLVDDVQVPLDTRFLLTTAEGPTQSPVNTVIPFSGKHCRLVS